MICELDTGPRTTPKKKAAEFVLYALSELGESWRAFDTADSMTDREVGLVQDQLNKYHDRISKILNR